LFSCALPLIFDLKFLCFLQTRRKGSVVTPSKDISKWRKMAAAVSRGKIELAIESRAEKNTNKRETRERKRGFWKRNGNLDFLPSPPNGGARIPLEWRCSNSASSPLFFFYLCRFPPSSSSPSLPAPHRYPLLLDNKKIRFSIELSRRQWVLFASLSVVRWFSALRIGPSLCVCEWPQIVFVIFFSKWSRVLKYQFSEIKKGCGDEWKENLKMFFFGFSCILPPTIERLARHGTRLNFDGKK